jgi:hypothetical protein
MDNYSNKILPWEDGYSENEERFRDDVDQVSNSNIDPLDYLNNKLQLLRDKWKNDWPKSSTDPRWPEFEADKNEAEDLKSEIEKIKKLNESEVDCYWCKEKKALSGDLFPFCSPECKKKWQDENCQNRRVGKRYRTIEECQRRIEEIKGGKKDSVEKIAAEIFGNG